MLNFKNLVFTLVFTLIFMAGSLFADNHGAMKAKKDGYSVDWQIKAFSSAAPDFIADYATVIGVDGSVLKEGTNGWTCESFMPMPEGGFPSAHHAAPACSDKNAVAWATAYKATEIPKLEADGWIWMLHGDLGVDNFTLGTDGQKDAGHEHYIESGSHMMLMPKDPSSLDGLSTDYTTGAPYVMYSGTPYVHMMIPLENYYDYQPESNPKNN